MSGRVVDCGQGMVIRPAWAGDLEQIVDFNCRLRAETERTPCNRDTVRFGVGRVLRDPGLGRYFLAVVDGRVVGQLMVSVEWDDIGGGAVWWLRHAYVAEEYRGRGVFNRLFRQVERKAREEEDVLELRALVVLDNDGMRRTLCQVEMAPFAHAFRRSRDASARRPASPAVTR